MLLLFIVPELSHKTHHRLQSSSSIVEVPASTSSPSNSQLALRVRMAVTQSRQDGLVGQHNCPSSEHDGGLHSVEHAGGSVPGRGTSGMGQTRSGTAS